MQDTRHHCNYLYRKPITTMINDNNDYLLNKHEDDLFNAPTLTLLDNLYNFSINLIQSSNVLINQAHSVVSNTIMVTDTEYIPSQAITIDKHGRRMVTRSQTTKKKDRAKREREASDIWDDPPSNFEFDNLRLANKTRNEFMIDVFGPRDDLDIHNPKTFALLQKSDNLIKILNTLFNSDPKNYNQNDLLYLQEWNKPLYDMFISNNIKRDCGMLCVELFDQSMQDFDLKPIVPFVLRGKLLRWAHHNSQVHHPNADQTYDILFRSYWWNGMKKDCELHVQECPVCQYTNGSPRKRAPLADRILPPPLTHVFMDFLGPVYGRFYLLFIIDYATGYCRILPTDGCDAITVIELLFKRWVSDFGWFKLLETDWGSAFNSKLLAVLSRLAEFNIELAEPQNHRSIGKVERAIGMGQNIIRKYNLLLKNKLTDRLGDTDLAWSIIEILVPMIQLAFNQRRSRISAISPNMLIYGRNMYQPLQLERIIENFKATQKNPNLKLTQSDYDKFINLFNKIHMAFDVFAQDWTRYMWLTRQSYNNRNNITKEKILKNKIRFSVGTKILYYCGDLQVGQSKWKIKWTGPWIVDEHLNDSSLLIADPETGNQKRVSFDRIKPFVSSDHIRYDTFTTQNQEYRLYKQKLFDEFQKYNVNMRSADVDLDYRKYNL